MKFRTASLLVATSAFLLSASLAAAQSGVKPIPKPSDRRSGELEGWSDTPKTQAKEGPKAKEAQKGKTEKKPVATAAKPAKQEGGAPDGGLPLPNSRNDPNDYAPVGFDKDGKLGTGMKF